MKAPDPESIADCQQMIAVLDCYFERQRPAHGYTCACHQCQAHGNINDAYWHLSRQMEELKRA